MFVVNVDKNLVTVSQTEPITSGSSKVYLVEFYFSSEWEELDRVAVFRAGEKVIHVMLDETNVCFMPWEVMVTPGLSIELGVYGSRNGDVVLPTIWAPTTTILEGVITGGEAQPPSPSLYQQILFRLEKLETGGGSPSNFAPLTDEELEVLLK